MNKKILFSSLLVLQLSMFSSVVFAQTGNRGETRDRTDEVFTEQKNTKQLQIEKIRAEYKAKLAALKDENKKAILAHIDSTLSKHNANRVLIMSGHLSLMESILSNLEKRTGVLQSKGQDVTGIFNAITSARTALQSAQSAVTNQSSKVYIIEIGDESNLGQAAKTQRDALAADLVAVRQKITTAKNAVYAAISALATMTGESLSNNK